MRATLSRTPAQYPVPECTVFLNVATGCYGFSMRFEGRHPHYVMDTFRTLDNLMAWVDAWQERIWEEPSDADESKLLVSRSYKEGTVSARMHASAYRQEPVPLTATAWRD